MKYTFFLPCPKGLEEVLLQELIDISVEQNFSISAEKVSNGGVLFSSDINAVYWCNLHLRVASRVLVLIKKSYYYDEYDIYKAALNIDWHSLFNHNQTIRLDISAHKSPLQSIQFVNLKIKDGICDYFRKKTGIRPSVNTQNPDIRIFTHVDQENVFFYLDTTGEALFKRGWRWDKGTAPMKENLAAGILRIANWHKNYTLDNFMFMDTMCGSGTLAIEAMQIATKTPAGINRDFAFKKLKFFVEETWQNILEKSKKSIQKFSAGRIFASDIDARVVAIAQENMVRANAGGILLSVENAKSMAPVGDKGILVVNPPYGERIFVKQKDGTIQQEDFFSEWAANLKKNYANWQVFILTADLQTPTQMHLKPQQKTVLFNGDLECRLFRFDMVTGSMQNK